MRISLPEITELSKDWDIAKDQVQRQLQQMASAINTGWGQEHNSDGSHGDVVADSVELQGAKIGESVNLPFDAARYVTYDDAAWNVTAENQMILRYSRIGQMVFVQFRVSGSSLTGAATDIIALGIKLPELHALPATDAYAYITAGTAEASITTITSSTATSIPRANADIVLATSRIVNSTFPNDIPSTAIFLKPYSGDSNRFVNWSVGTGFEIYGFICFTCEFDNVARLFRE